MARAGGRSAGLRACRPRPCGERQGDLRAGAARGAGDRRRRAAARGTGGDRSATCRPLAHRTGRVVDAVYPSFAIPGMFPPVARTDGRLLVDGGVLDNLPVATMARTGEGPVIAVDVTGGIGRFQRAQRPGVALLARPV